MAPLFEPLKNDEEKQVCNAFCCMNATIEIHLKSNVNTIFVSECTQIFSTTTIRQESLVVYTNVWSVVYSTITNTPHILPCAPLFLPFFLYFSSSSSTSLCACYTPIASKQHQIRLVRKGFFEFNLTSFNISYSNC